MKTMDELTAGVPAGPAVDPADVAASLTRALVVLDDDPTGTQSVADLPVITGWSVDDLAWALSTGAGAVYVMTNSRSLDPADAERVNVEVVTNALAAAERVGRRVAFVSRSDSTLRGHFPVEPATIADLLERAGTRVDGIVLSPAFPDAGRITVHGTHYAGAAATGFVPVGETEFADDKTFGYTASALPAWVEEKTAGAVRADDVIVIDLAALRTDEDAVVAALSAARNRAPIAVDCVEENDLLLLARALQRAEDAGSTFVYRVGPPFVRARIGQAPRAPLTAAEARPADFAPESDAVGGLVVVGSHVGLTGRQVDALRAATATPDRPRRPLRARPGPARRPRARRRRAGGRGARRRQCRRAPRRGLRGRARRRGVPRLRPARVRRRRRGRPEDRRRALPPLRHRQGRHHLLRRRQPRPGRQPGHRARADAARHRLPVGAAGRARRRCALHRVRR